MSSEHLLLYCCMCEMQRNCTTVFCYLQIPELPDNLKLAPGAQPEVVRKRRYAPPRPDEHFYTAMRDACCQMELLVKDTR